MAEKDIFERDRSGEVVDMNDPDFYKIYDVIHDTMAKLQRMNSSVMSAEEVRQVFADVTGTEVDDTLTLFPPFYMDFGKNLRVGKNVLIQQCCTFFDRCGITIGDNTFIAPKVNLIAINHPANPTKRSCTYGAPITIGRNVWIGIAHRAPGRDHRRQLHRGRTPWSPTTSHPTPSSQGPPPGRSATSPSRMNEIIYCGGDVIGMIQLDILAVGNLERDEEGNILEANSTSVLIRTPDRLIVVDPSTDYMKPMVKSSFRQIGVFPKDVDTVILTHAHRDHVENLRFYKNAKVYIHSGASEEIPGATVIDEDEFRVCDGVTMVHTPGHCPEECSVFVEADRRYVIAGDTIPLEDNFRKNVPPAISSDRDLALQSIKRVRKYADVVIPGHGFPFMADR